VCPFDKTHNYRGVIGLITSELSGYRLIREMSNGTVLIIIRTSRRPEFTLPQSDLIWDYRWRISHETDENK
jgi:hypothetical protein